MRKLLFLCILATACDSPTVPERFLRDVYDFRLRTPALRVLRWPTGTTVNVMALPDADATLSQHLNSAVEHGVRVWNTAALYGEVTLQQTDAIENADVLVQYSTTTSPLDINSCQRAGAQAETTFCQADDEDHLRPYPFASGGTSRVKFLVTVRTQAATDAATVRSLVAHELGHVLGIAQHSPKPTDLMWGGTPLNREDTSPADRATLQVLYHTIPDITP